MRQMTEDEFTIHWLKRLKAMTNNFFIENKNFKATKAEPGYRGRTDMGYKEAHHFAEYPRTFEYVSGPLKEQATHIMDEIDNMIEYFEEEPLN